MEDAKLHQTATCKAGHAVAHVRLGLGYRRVSIDPRRMGLIDKADNERAPVSDAMRARLVTLVHCAGYAALIATGHREEDASRCTSDDLRKANDLIERWNLRADLASWKAEALDLIQRPHNVAAVRLVAQHLLERQKLDSDWVGCILALLDGDMTENDFAAYVRFREALS